MKNNSIFFFTFGLLFILLGHFREYFFAHYNNVMYILYNNEASHLEVPNVFFVLLETPYKTVYYLKYVFTAFFVGGFFILSYLAVKIYTKNKNLLKWVLYSYLLILLLSGLLMLWAYFIKVKLDDDEYSVSRWLMGIAQSPLIALFFLASSQLITKQAEN